MSSLTLCFEGEYLLFRLGSLITFPPPLSLWWLQAWTDEDNEA